MKKEIEERIKKELSSIDNQIDNQRLDKWIAEIFPHQDIRKIMLLLPEAFKREKSGMINMGDLITFLEKHKIERHRAYYVLGKLSANGIIRKEKLHNREAHFHTLDNEGRDMLSEAINSLFDYVDGKIENKEVVEDEQGK